MNLIGIVGTNSDHSTNRQLLQFIQRHFANQEKIEICEIKDIPAFNKPKENQTPEEVQGFIAEL